GNLGQGRAQPGGEAAKARLEHLDLATGKLTTLADAVDAVAVTAEGRALVVRKDVALTIVPADRPAGDDPAAKLELDLSRVLVTVEPAAEHVQMYEETARLLRHHYWVEDMAGIDWDAVVARYRPLAERVATRDELHDLIWELNGELGTSHAYVFHHDDQPTAQQRVGHLGADLEPADGGWRVAAVPHAEPSVPGARSPLEPAGVTVGDVIESVD
ncbi:peptidase S41, partial [Acidimicrobiaceae bacterium USS-CC1]|nr:peptidase S41 [Acidiferrimicrobium australe]